MPAEQTSLVWYHADEGAIPTAARQPWLVEGSPTFTLVDDGVSVAVTGDLALLWRPMFRGDRISTPTRIGDRAEIQWRLRGVSQVPGWGSGRSPIIAAMDDAERAVGISIGPEVHWIDPYTGSSLGALLTGFPWTTLHDFLFVKDRAAGWQIYIDGRLVGRLPYLHAPSRPASVVAPPRFAWGDLDAAGDSEAVWQFIEAGLNADLPRQWKIERLANTVPPPIRETWRDRLANERWRAVHRMVAGMAQSVVNAMDVAWELTTARRESFQSYAFEGDVLPNALPTPWTLIGSVGSVSIVRERVRFASSTLPTAAEATFTQVRSPAEFRARATFTLRTFTAGDPDGRVGPYIEIRNGHRAIRAELFEIATDDYGWALTEGTDAGPVTVIGNITWRVDPFQAHEVEVQVLGRARVLLLVNGARVDEVPYASLSLATASRVIRIGRNGQPGGMGILCQVDIAPGLAETRYTDLTRRELFLQTVAERLVFAGGCERNDHLDTLVRSHHELQELRGTEHNALLEIRRLSCSEDSGQVVEQTEAGWYLDVTYPELTPIYLDADGFFTHTFAEVHFAADNFTINELARLLATYIYPISVVELRYTITLATFLTTAAVNTATTTFTVEQPTGFEAGDTVTVRDAANVVIEEGQILTIDQITGVVVMTLVAGPYPIGSTMRKNLLET